MKNSISAKRAKFKFLVTPTTPLTPIMLIKQVTSFHMLYQIANIRCLYYLQSALLG